jgi:hypothetical protein
VQGADAWLPTSTLSSSGWGAIPGSHTGPGLPPSAASPISSCRRIDDGRNDQLVTTMPGTTMSRAIVAAYPNANTATPRKVVITSMLLSNALTT